jgi:hypothetical protein
VSPVEPSTSSIAAACSVEAPATAKLLGGLRRPVNDRRNGGCSSGLRELADLDAPGARPALHLRSDPAFKLACGRLPDTGRDLCSQPTLSRLENAPRLRDVIRLTYTLVDAWMDSYPCEPMRCRSRPSAALAVQRSL